MHIDKALERADMIDAKMCSWTVPTRLKVGT